MDIRYDKTADTVYLRVTEGPVAQTLKMHDRLLVDIDVSGNTLGFEILDASSQGNLIRSIEQGIATGIPVSISSDAAAVM